jgi:hypothetical protein
LRFNNYIRLRLLLHHPNVSVEVSCIATA